MPFLMICLSFPGTEQPGLRGLHCGADWALEAWANTEVLVKTGSMQHELEETKLVVEMFVIVVTDSEMMQPPKIFFKSVKSVLN